MFKWKSEFPLTRKAGSKKKKKNTQKTVNTQHDSFSTDKHEIAESVSMSRVSDISFMTSLEVNIHVPVLVTVAQVEWIFSILE